jgi:predicted KAP-like P-loop ATPase
MATNSSAKAGAQSAETHHEVFADRPIEHGTDDLFGRQPFARTIASTITNWRGSESLTIAISGAWGSGKSSLKNMILEALSQNRRTRPYPVEFNPWKYATPAETANAFFRELSIALRRVDPTKSGEERARRWERYSKLLTLTSELAQSTADALPTLMMLAAFAGVSATITENPTLSVLLIFASVALLSLAAGLKFSAAFSGKVAEWIKAASTDEPIEEIRKRLREDLAGLERPVLVIVDDIDRLTRRETRLLFQHIKANADFPNVLYLLLYQRDIVESHLTTATLNGRRYLEKIVDLHFDLPVAGQEEINKLLFEGLNQILGKLKGAPEFDRQRWGNVYFGGLQAFFATPRNVKRFLSTLGVQFSLFQGEAALEVNQIDMIALEALRLFEPEVFQALSTATNLLTRSSESTGDREQQKAQVELIVKLADDGRRDQLRRLLQEMFPRIGWVFGGSNYGDDWISEWSTQHRICSPTFFDRYFRLAVPQQEISQSDFQILVSVANSRKKFVAEFLRISEQGKSGPALAMLDDYKQKIPLEYAAEFLPALLDIGELFEDGTEAFLGPFTRITRVALWYTRQETDVAKRGEHLLNAMRASTGLAVMARILRGEDKRREKPSSDGLAMFTDQQLENAKELWLQRFAEEAEQDLIGLAHNHQFLSMLYALLEWKGDATTRDWVARLILTDKGLIAFLKAAAGIVTRTTLGDHTSTQHTVTRLQTISDFASVEEVEKRVASFSREQLTADEKSAIESFERALKRRASGKSDDGFSDDE